MKFSEIIAQASELLQRKGRITYRSLRREFDLDEEALEDLKFELTEARRVAIDDGGQVLVWQGNGAPVSPVSSEPTSSQSPASNGEPLATTTLSDRAGPLFCTVGDQRSAKLGRPSPMPSARSSV